MSRGLPLWGELGESQCLLVWPCSSFLDCLDQFFRSPDFRSPGFQSEHWAVLESPGLVPKSSPLTCASQPAAGSEVAEMVRQLPGDS